ncbi:MAG: hypothetical protein E7500_00395 [Ruminococcus sp.]|nr:hypothetical protein [Ruminococcus sp.]
MLDFYKNVWHGSFDGADEELTQLLSRASDIVDNAICMSGYTVSTVPEIYGERVKKAICVQTDHIIFLGGIESITEGSYSSVSLGKFSYSDNASGESKNSSATSLCDLAENYLLPTGLLYRGVSVL